MVETDTKLIAAWLYGFCLADQKIVELRLLASFHFDFFFFFFLFFENIIDLFAFEILGSIFLVLHVQ